MNTIGLEYSSCSYRRKKLGKECEGSMKSITANIITALLFAGFMCTGCVTGETGGGKEERKKIVDNYDHAVKLYREGAYEKALAAVKNDVLGRDSTFFPAYALRGRIYFEMKEYEKAVEEFRSYYDADRHGETWNKYLNRDEYPAAIELADAYMYEGWAFRMMGNPEEALKCHKRALKLYKEQEFQNRLSKVNISIGDDFFDLEKYEKAAEGYLQGLSYDETKFMPHAMLVRTYKKLGRDMDMLTHLSVMINMDPERALSWYKKRAQELDWTGKNAGLKSIFLESEIDEENLWVLREIMDLHGFAADEQPE